MDDDVGLKNKKQRVEVEGIDRISSLPNELIHRIISDLDAKVAVQLCILSKRWKYVWKTLPFLNFTSYSQDFMSAVSTTKFVKSFLAHRNHQHDISKMKLYFFKNDMPPTPVYKFITYAIQHNVQNLDVEIKSIVARVFKLSAFSSNSLKELKLNIRSIQFLESDCWDLPGLTNLHLNGGYKLHKSYLTCLLSLQTLFLDSFKLPTSITFPALTDLHLKNCTIPNKFWDLPALLNLTLDNVKFLDDPSLFFPALVNLRNLTLFFHQKIVATFSIKCPQLVNLEINTSMTITVGPSVKIFVLAPKIRNFSCNGVFPIKFGDSELENVNIKLRENVRYIDSTPADKLRNYYPQVKQMFEGLGRAKMLTLGLETIKAVTAVSDILDGSLSPFYKLKYVKLPPEYTESSISACLKSYLLGRCPKATIVTTLPQKDLIPPSEVASVTAQPVELRGPLAAPTEVAVDSGNIPKSVPIDTVGVQEEHVVHNSVIHAEGTSNDPVISFKENRDFGLWQGHEVKSEFVCLLDLIIGKYPETFKDFAAKSKKFCTMKLNMLCTSINDFTKISLAEVNAEMVVEYRNVFADLQDLGFNLSWLVSRLNHIEQLCLSQPLIPQLHAIDCHIGDAKNNLKDLESRVNDAKNKLDDLHTLRAEKMQEIQKAFGIKGTNLAAVNIGDSLFSGP